MNESMLRNSVILRMIIIAGLSLVLLVPTLFIEFLISDRQKTNDSAVSDITQSWGGAQTLTGLILSVPYRQSFESKNTALSYSIHYIHLLPSKLFIRASLTPEVRYRGIYQVGLYNSRLTLDGEFPRADLDQLGIGAEDLLWNDAFITFGISDLKGIRDSVNLRMDNSSYASEPGVLSNDVVEAGMTFKTPLEKGATSHTFSLQLNLNGSSELRFTPVGQVTQATMDSPWSNPSFVGSFLPEARDISASAFHAQWKVLNLNRNFPQVWAGNRYKVAESSFGVRLFLPVDEYQKTSRTVKYAILFIGLTFLSFFLSEVIAKAIIHPVQYVLIGFALILFYVLLLSISEHLAFNIAYGVSSVAIIALITVYSRWITASNRIASIISGVLVLLYGFLFVTLQLQDYALVLGSVGLFLILSLVMYLTRKVDWFALNKLTQNGRVVADQ